MHVSVVHRTVAEEPAGPEGHKVGRGLCACVCVCTCMCVGGRERDRERERERQREREREKGKKAEEKPIIRIHFHRKQAN